MSKGNAPAIGISAADIAADLEEFRNEDPKAKLFIDKPVRGEIRPLQAVRLSEVETKEVQWLWNPFLALGTFNILEGEEGIGKTFLVCALASAIASGKGLPLVSSNEHIEPSNVLLISAEDSLSHVLKLRLESMNAPTDRIIAIEEPFTLDESGIFRLSMAIAEFEPKLIVMDPIFSYTGRINLDRDNDIRSITDALKRLADKYQCAIVGIRHIGKSKGFGDARNAGLNGVGWRASARSVLLIGKNPENEHQKALCQTKNNLAQRYEKSLGFEIRDSQFFWTGESSLTVTTMLSALKNESGEERHERQDAKIFLQDSLRSGEQYSKDIFADAKQYGISDRTLNRAAHELKIQKRKEGFNPGKWYWSLPEGCHEGAEDCHINKNGNLRVNDENKASYSNDLTEGCHDNIYGNLRGDVGNLRSNGLSTATTSGKLSENGNSTNQKKCENCKTEVESYSVRCPKCGELPLGI